MKSLLYTLFRPARRIALTVIFAVIFLPPVPASAESDGALPLLEIGMAGGVLSWPHYAGSDQTYTLPVAFPFFMYRGDFIRADRSGVRGYLYVSDRFALDLGFSFGLPVKSTDNGARRGMPDLPLSGEIGPRLIVRLYDGGNGMYVLARAPIRRAWDIEGKPAGWVAEPEILFDHNALPLNISLRLRTGLLYGSSEYHDFYYSVGEKYAEPGRPAYKAGEGLNSWFASLTVKRSFRRNFVAGFLLKWRSMAGSAVAGSPLVKQEVNISGGAWFVWYFWESAGREKESPRLLRTDMEKR